MPPTHCLKGVTRWAPENGVSQDEVIELLTHLAFSADWPNAMSAIAVAKQVFEG